MPMYLLYLHTDLAFTSLKTGLSFNAEVQKRHTMFNITSLPFRCAARLKRELKKGRCK